MVTFKTYGFGKKQDNHRFDLFDKEKCHDCPYYCQTADPYNTGDHGYIHYTCEGPADDLCPLVDRMDDLVVVYLNDPEFVREVLSEAPTEWIAKLIASMKTDPHVLRAHIMARIDEHAIKIAKINIQDNVR